MSPTQEHHSSQLAVDPIAYIGGVFERATPCLPTREHTTRD